MRERTMRPMLLAFVTVAVILTFAVMPQANVHPECTQPQTRQQLVVPKSQVPDRGRPTRPDDEMPLFNFDDYFTGTWTFEWDVPEGVLGPGGTISGRTVYRRLEGPFYEAETEANGPEGAFTVRELIAYQKETKS